MLFSVYMGPGQRKNMMTNTSTSMHFESQTPTIHHGPGSSLVSAEAGMKPHPCRNSKWQITDQSAILRTVFLSFHVVDGNGTGCVLGPQLSSAFETMFLLGTDCPPVNQEVTWLAVLKIYPKSHPSSFSRGSVGKKSTQVQFLDQEAPLKEEMATHSSILAWKIPWTEEPGGLQSVGITKSQTGLRAPTQY